MAGAGVSIRRLPLRAQGTFCRTLFAQSEPESHALSWSQSSSSSQLQPQSQFRSQPQAPERPHPAPSSHTGPASTPPPPLKVPHSVPQDAAHTVPHTAPLSSGAVSSLPGLWRGRLATPSERVEAGDQTPLLSQGAGPRETPLLSHSHSHSLLGHSHSHPLLSHSHSLGRARHRLRHGVPISRLSQRGAWHVSPRSASPPAPQLAHHGCTAALPWACRGSASAHPHQGVRGLASAAGEGGEGGTGDGPAGEGTDVVAATGEGSIEDSAAVEEAAPVEPRERLRRREKWGSYDDDIEEEIFQGGFEVKGEDGKPYFKHLYDARRTIDEWIADPSLWGMLAAPPEEGHSDPAYEAAERQFEEESGPELRWETRLILGPGGNAWHPANRKVKVSVYVKELGLTPLARERLLALVGRRYKPNRDELTIVSERYAQREENRKDVLRILLALIDEARRADALAAAAGEGGSPVPPPPLAADSQATDTPTQAVGSG